METSGKRWAALKVTDVYSISNGLTRQTQSDLVSPDLVEHAVKQGGCSNAKDFGIARSYSDFINTIGGFCAHRHQRTLTNLTTQKGVVEIQQFIRTLRDHGHPEGQPFHPDSIAFASQVCMHLGFGPTRVYQTTGSLICYLDRTAPAFFAHLAPAFSNPSGSTCLAPIPSRFQAAYSMPKRSFGGMNYYTAPR